MDSLEILREIERFKADAPPDTYLLFEKRYGVRRAVWVRGNDPAYVWGLPIFYCIAYKDDARNVEQSDSVLAVAKWFKEV